MEDGSLVEKDLWIDERRGIVLDSQVGGIFYQHDIPYSNPSLDVENVLLRDTKAP
jgi:hypothetical protein